MMSNGWMVGMGWIWILSILVLVVAVYLGVRAATRSAGDGGRPESPEDVLKKRYARGEIGREEYEERLRDLRQ